MLLSAITGCKKEDPPTTTTPPMHEIQYIANGSKYWLKHYDPSTETYSPMTEQAGQFKKEFSRLTWSYLSMEAIPDSGATVIIRIYVDNILCNSDTIHFDESITAKAECEN